MKPEIHPLSKYNKKTVFVAVGASCDNYYSDTSRTYLFNPPTVMKDTYQVLLGMKEACVASLVPGNPMKNVYQAAVNYLRRTRGFGYLQGHVPVDLGSIVGLNHLVFSLSLDRTNETKLERNMVLILRTGFCNLPLPVSLKPKINEILFPND
jgi:Xaa-Pro aminopeptidase